MDKTCSSYETSYAAKELTSIFSDIGPEDVIKKPVEKETLSRQYECHSGTKILQ
ncbi:MAG TPA: hypothetical protein VJ772_06070 [Nitrososphaeraceae archaeon]|nr:hypothetical protein [Nitrososphaeraceae archaeon]